jgi:hypothetical protein
MRKITKSILVLSLLGSVVAWPAGVAAQAVQYYADCQACAKYLGGPGYIGPFSSEKECIAERDIEIAQGNPIGLCSTSTHATPGHPVRARIGVPLLGVLGAVAGGAGGFALSHGQTATVTQNDRDKTVNGAMIGGGAALVLGTVTHLRAMPTAVSAVVAGAATYVGVDGYGRDRELNGLQDAAKTRTQAAEAAVAVGALTWAVKRMMPPVAAPWIRLPKRMGIGVTSHQVRMRWSW